VRRAWATSLRFLVCGAVVSPGVAWAQAPPPQALAHARVKLEYSAPIELSCPDRDQFASAIATRLGYEPVVADSTDDTKTLSVAYRAEKTAVRVTLRLSNAAKEIEGEKTILSETGSCADLGGAAAFAAAILLDPRTMFPRAPRPAAPGPGTGASLDSHSPGTWPWYEPPPIPPVPPPPPPPGVPLRWRAGLGMASCAGCGPSVSIGGALFLGVSKGRLGVDAGVRADLPGSTAAPSGRTIRSSVVVGELFPHARFGPARLGMLASIGTLFGDSQGEKQASLLASAGIRGAFEWTVAEHVFVRMALDGSVVLSRVSLRVEGVEVWSTPAVTAGANLGGGVEF
jgi:hypothetical protein